MGVCLSCKVHSMGIYERAFHCKSHGDYVSPVAVLSSSVSSLIECVFLVKYTAYSNEFSLYSRSDMFK
jgi:hypothetical protein